jgi:hypothetical protein
MNHNEFITITELHAVEPSQILATFDSHSTHVHDVGGVSEFVSIPKSDTARIILKPFQNV